MTTPPPYGPQSGYPASQPYPPQDQPGGYQPPQQNQQFQPQPGSYPAGSYGTQAQQGQLPMYGGGQGGQPGRPGMVTAAAVLAFVFGGFAIIGSFLVLVASSLVATAGQLCANNQLNDAQYQSNCNTVAGAGGFLKVVSVGLIIVAILLIWGGVVALSGKNQQILAIGAAVYIVLAIVSIIAGGGVGFTSILGIAAPVLILVFLFNPASRAWFRAKGGKTF